MTDVRELLAAAAPTAVLDDAHVGDIKGALGTVAQHDTAPRRSWAARLATLLAIMGPGLIVMVGDNDAGGVATYAQAGQNYGTSLLWTLLLLIPVLMVNQEMVVRLGLVTGVGHARLILERFGKFWGAFSVGDLFILNFLTIATEFIGISLGLEYFGVSKYISVPIAAVMLVAVAITGSFQRWERFMFLFIAVSALTLPLAFVVHPAAARVAHDFVVPSIQGGLDSTSLLLIIGIVGTTVAPWQLFFQQSNVIDKRLTPRWMRYERTDTLVGVVIVVVAAAALMIAAAVPFAHTPLAGRFTDAGDVARGLAQYVNPWVGSAFAIVLMDAAVLGASAVTLSTSYAFGDVFGMKHSLHRRWKDARGFYSIYSVLIVLAAALVLIPGAPLGLMTLGVQALAGILLPSATVFLLLLCNDRHVLGPWVNKPWLNAVAGIIVGVLVMLSLILAATTLFPDIDVRALTGGMMVALVASLAAVGLLTMLGRRRARVKDVSFLGDPAAWRMPPLSQLAKPSPSATRSVALAVLRGYLAIAATLSVVKVIQLAIGS